MLSSERLLHVCVILVSYLTAAAADQHKQIGPVDYCESETFEGRCSGNDVILITSAQYGRMALGRCVTKNYGHVGCKVDARHVLDGLCSGRKSCHIRANHHFLLAIKSRACPHDVSAYLSVSYSCVPVLQGSGEPCLDNTSTSLQSAIGYITPGGTGSTRCPLVIKPPTGTNLNFTLFRFSSLEADNTRSTNSRCFEVLEIREGEKSQKVISCAKDPRQRPVYVTEGSEVTISFAEGAFLHQLGTFLLSFKATCPDPVLPRNTRFERHSETEGRVVCDVTNDAWTLRCVDGQWEELNLASLCKSDKGWMSSGSGKDGEKGGIMIVAIGAIVGMVVGGILLWMAITLYKKCKRCIRDMKPPTKPTVMIEVPGDMTFGNHLKPITETDDVEAAQPFTDVQIERHPSQRRTGTLTRLPSKARNGTLQRVAVEYRMPNRREVRASYHGGNGNESPGNGTLPRGPGTKYQSKTLSRVPRSPLSNGNGNGTVPRSPKITKEEASPRSSPKGPVTVHNFNYGTPPRGVKPGSSPAGISREHYAKINRPLPPTPDSDHDYECPVPNPNIALEESMSIGSRSTLNSSTYAYNDSSTYANRSDDNRSIGDRSAIGTPTRSTLRSNSSEEARCHCGHGMVNGDSSLSPDTTDNSGGTDDDRPLYANHTLPGEDKKNANEVPDVMNRSGLIEDELPVYANHTISDNQQNTKENEKSKVIEDDRPVYANHMVQNEKDLPKNLTDLLKDKKAVILDDRPVYANHTMPNIKSSVESNEPMADDRPVYANHTMPTAKTIDERIQNKNMLNEQDLKDKDILKEEELLNEKEMKEKELKEKELKELQEKEEREKEKELLKERRVSTFKDY